MSFLSIFCVIGEKLCGGSIMTKRFTIEEVKNYIEFESSSGCLLLSTDYKNNRTKLKLKCKCDNEFITDLNHFKNQNQHQCPDCGKSSSIKNRTMDHKEFVKKVYEFERCDYSVLSIYKKTNINITIKHNKCGHVYSVKPNNFINGHRCPKCYGNPKYNTEIFKEKINELYKNEYCVVGEYRGNNFNIKVVHNKCKTVYNARPNGMLNGGYKCPKCFPAHFKTHDEFIGDIKKIHKEEYEILSEYIRNNFPIKVKHVGCGYVWETIPARLLNNKGCPLCNNGNSKGELIIKKYLKSRNISFIAQYRIKECRDKNPLPFDFAIFKDDILKLLIEFDGKHHYEENEYYGGAEFLQEVQKRDSIKNNYCKEFNIELLRIPCWEIDNIESIIGYKLNNDLSYINWGSQKVI
jgi:hypothetical protein